MEDDRMSSLSQLLEDNPNAFDQRLNTELDRIKAKRKARTETEKLKSMILASASSPAPLNAPPKPSPKKAALSPKTPIPSAKIKPPSRPPPNRPSPTKKSTAAATPKNNPTSSAQLRMNSLLYGSSEIRTPDPIIATPTPTATTRPPLSLPKAFSTLYATKNEQEHEEDPEYLQHQDLDPEELRSPGSEISLHSSITYVQQKMEERAAAAALTANGGKQSMTNNNSNGEFVPLSQQALALHQQIMAAGASASSKSPIAQQTPIVPSAQLITTTPPPPQLHFQNRFQQQESNPRPLVSQSRFVDHQADVALEILPYESCSPFGAKIPAPPPRSVIFPQEDEILIEITPDDIHQDSQLPNELQQDLSSPQVFIQQEYPQQQGFPQRWLSGGGDSNPDPLVANSKWLTTSAQFGDEITQQQAQFDYPASDLLTSSRFISPQLTQPTFPTDPINLQPPPTENRLDSQRHLSEPQVENENDDNNFSLSDFRKRVSGMSKERETATPAADRFSQPIFSTDTSQQRHPFRTALLAQYRPNVLNSPKTVDHHDHGEKVWEMPNQISNQIQEEPQISTSTPQPELFVHHQHQDQFSPPSLVFSSSRHSDDSSELAGEYIDSKFEEHVGNSDYFSSLHHAIPTEPPTTRSRGLSPMTFDGNKDTRKVEKPGFGLRENFGGGDVNSEVSFGGESLASSGASRSGRHRITARLQPPTDTSALRRAMQDRLRPKLNSANSPPTPQIGNNIIPGGGDPDLSAATGYLNLQSMKKRLAQSLQEDGGGQMENGIVAKREVQSSNLVEEENFFEQPQKEQILSLSSPPPLPPLTETQPQITEFSVVEIISEQSPPQEPEEKNFEIPTLSPDFAIQEREILSVGNQPSAAPPTHPNFQEIYLESSRLISSLMKGGISATSFEHKNPKFSELQEYESAPGNMNSSAADDVNQTSPEREIKIPQNFSTFQKIEEKDFGDPEDRTLDPSAFRFNRSNSLYNNKEKSEESGSKRSSVDLGEKQKELMLQNLMKVPLAFSDFESAPLPPPLKSRSFTTFSPPPPPTAANALPPQIPTDIPTAAAPAAVADSTATNATSGGGGEITNPILEKLLSVKNARGKNQQLPPPAVTNNRHNAPLPPLIDDFSLYSDLLIPATAIKDPILSEETETELSPPPPPRDVEKTVENAFSFSDQRSFSFSSSSSPAGAIRNNTTLPAGDFEPMVSRQNRFQSTFALSPPPAGLLPLDEKESDSHHRPAPLTLIDPLSVSAGASSARLLNGSSQVVPTKIGEGQMGVGSNPGSPAAVLTLTPKSTLRSRLFGGGKNKDNIPPSSPHTPTTSNNNNDPLLYTPKGLNNTNTTTSGQLSIHQIAPLTPIAALSSPSVAPPPFSPSPPAQPLFSTGIPPLVLRGDMRDCVRRIPLLSPLLSEERRISQVLSEGAELNKIVGKTGESHKRTFSLNKDRTALVWKSGRFASTSEIRLLDITEISIVPPTPAQLQLMLTQQSALVQTPDPQSQLSIILGGSAQRQQVDLVGGWSQLREWAVGLALETQRQAEKERVANYLKQVQNGAAHMPGPNFAL